VKIEDVAPHIERGDTCAEIINYVKVAYDASHAAKISADEQAQKARAHEGDSEG
jgi:hypothetical protein